MAEKHEHIAVARRACPLVQWDIWEPRAVAVAGHAAAAFGAALPEAVGEIVIRDGVSAIRVAPRRFWFMADDASRLPRGLPVELGTALDLGEGRIRLDLETDRLREVVAQCIALDWEETKGRASFTAFHRVPVMFTRDTDVRGAFLVPRTFCQSLAEWIEGCR